MAPVSFAMLLVGFFDEDINCKWVVVGVLLPMMISHVLLVKGVYGYKAYRCMDRSRTVLVAEIVFFLGTVGLGTLQLARIKGGRHLAGSCALWQTTSILPAIFGLQSMEMVFISCCFVLAIRKSTHLPAGQGRISLYPTRQPSEKSLDAVSPAIGQGRGWWDYMPIKDPGYGSLPSPPHDPAQNGFGEHVSADVLNPSRKPSLKLEIPLSQPLRQTPGLHPSPQAMERSSPASSSSTASPVGTRYSKLIPKMTAFMKALRNELYYTAFASALSCTTAILTTVGVYGEYLWGISGWIALDWVVMSCLAFYSFDQVLCRRESEASLRERQDWSPILRQRHRPTASASAITSEISSVTPRRRPWRNADQQGFAETIIAPGASDEHFTRTRTRTLSTVSWRTDPELAKTRSPMDATPYEDVPNLHLGKSLKFDETEPPLPPLPVATSESLLPAALLRNL
ncbi:hypothetical protein PUNSTDRAFT_140013 [Punctularia strigosozonata HHB-11173 SS5]|uniref:uncharacterized protein n=1 Tax=Punctularia strigosozonata (strain HHB-11173) TaxID=741275 RepID=UPI0004416CD9|nr:uncharacterized protein PUNSTDRAFT_140013 [Punctularia strigosozonata HHB-11173 SS5]EIN13486.1 hypothetical protein PUNSTDRAFT_140013 [Punctularia strigosozonata HHB-11173 SS5]